MEVPINIVRLLTLGFLELNVFFFRSDVSGSICLVLIYLFSRFLSIREEKPKTVPTDRLTPLSTFMEC